MLPSSAGFGSPRSARFRGVSALISAWFRCWNLVGSADVLPFVEADLKRIASRVLEKAKEICCSKSVRPDRLWTQMVASLFPGSVEAEISRFAGVPAREMLRDEETSPSPVVVE